MCGVTSITRSVLRDVTLVWRKNTPISGRSPRIGRRVSLRVCSVLSRPPMMTELLSRMRTVVDAREDGLAHHERDALAHQHRGGLAVQRGEFGARQDARAAVRDHEVE